MAEADFTNDEEFMEWANEHYPHWFLETAGNIEAAYGGFCAGRRLSGSGPAPRRDFKAASELIINVLVTMMLVWMLVFAHVKLNRVEGQILGVQHSLAVATSLGCEADDDEE